MELDRHKFVDNVSTPITMLLLIGKIHINSKFLCVITYAYCILKRMWEYVTAWAGNITKEKSCVFTEISGMVNSILILFWK
jgi:uncharacterized membrane protein YagU involved in acid resistance